MSNSDSVQPAGDFAVLIPLGAHAAIAPIPIKRPITVIGSRKDVVRLHLDSSTVSKAHCVIVQNDWGCYVHDLGSRTHTWVNGQQITDADLADGDTLQIGRFQFKYIAPRKVRAKTEPIDGELLVSTLTDPLPLNTRVIQIGRRVGSDLQFDDSKVSNIHALLFSRNDQWLVRDLGSRTGVWLNKQPVRQEVLSDGSLLRIGNATLTFRERHLGSDLDDLDLSAPITLDKAPTPGKADDDFASPSLHPSDTGALDLTDELKHDDLAGDHADAIPSADALASLRRGWRAPVSDDASERPARPHVPPAAPAPLDDDAVADLLADRSVPEPIDLGSLDLADLVAEPPPTPGADSPSARAPEKPFKKPTAPPTPKPAPSEPLALESPDAEATQPAETASAIELSPLAIDEDAVLDLLSEPLAEAPAPADESVADELPAITEPAPAIEVPAAEATAVVDLHAEAPVDDDLILEAPAEVEPIAQTLPPLPATESAAAGIELDDLALDLEPLELDEDAAADLLAEAAPDAPFPADTAVEEIAPSIDPVVDEMPAVADEPFIQPEVADEQPEEIEIADFDLEPLALDEDAAAADLLAEAEPEAFAPAEAEIAEVAPAIEPVVDELPPVVEPVASEPVADVTNEAVAESEIGELELEPLAFDENAPADLLDGADSSSPFAFSTAVAEPEAPVEPIADELPPVIEPAAIEATPNVTNEQSEEIEFGDLDLEPLALDDDAIAELLAESGPTIPAPADTTVIESAVIEPVIDELPSVIEQTSAAEAEAIETPAEPAEFVAEPIAEQPAEIELEDFHIDLEPLALDDDALSDLLAEKVPDAPFPADVAAAEFLPAIDPVIDKLPPAVELPTAEAETVETPAESTEFVAEPVAEQPAEIELEDFAVDLEPLELDDDAVADLLAEKVPDAPFPADATAAEFLPTIDPVIDELPPAVEPIAEDVGKDVAADVSIEPSAEIGLDDFQIDLEPIAIDEDAAADLLAEPAADAAFPADPEAIESATVADPVIDELPHAFAPPEVVVDEIDLEPIDFTFESREPETPAAEAANEAVAEPEPSLESTAIPSPVIESAEIESLAPETTPAEEAINVDALDFVDEAEIPAVEAKAAEVEAEILPAAHPTPEAAEIAALGDEPEPVADLEDLEFDLELEPSAEISLDEPLNEAPAGDTLVEHQVAEPVELIEPAEPVAAEAPTEPVAETPAEIDFSVSRMHDDDALELLDDEPTAELPPTPESTAVAVPLDSIVPESKSNAGDTIIEAVVHDPVPPPVRYDAAAIEILDELPEEPHLDLSDADREDEIDETVSDTAMALDLSAFVDGDKDEDEAEWEDAPPPAEPVMEIGEDDLPPTQGGSLRDLIPDNPPLIGGMFTPEGPMLIGGSPVINFNAPPPAPGRRKPLRVGFGGTSGRPSPFAASEQGTIADAMIGRDANGSIDVFSTPSPTAEDLAAIASPESKLAEPKLAPVDDESPAAEALVETAAPLDTPLEIPLAGKSEEEEIQAVAELFRPRGPLPPIGPNGEAISPFGQVPIPAYRTETDLAAAAKLRRSRYRRIITLLVMTPALVGGGIFAVYNYVKPYSVIDAMITYEGLDRLGTEDAREFRTKQTDNLQNEQIRQKAIQTLPSDVTDYGFLKAGQSIDKILDRDPAIRWPAERPGVMRLRMHSFDKAGDLARMRALAQALVTSSDSVQAQHDRDQAKTLLDNDMANADSKRRQLESINATLQDLQQAGNTRPDLQQIAKLQEDRKKAEADLTAAKSARQELEASLQVLQRPESVAPSTQTTVDVSKSDEALAALAQKLAEVQKQSEADKAQAAAQSTTARKALDNSIAQFQKDLNGAQQLKQSPELAAYVDAANRIFIQTRELTEDLIRRQENQRTRLAELKARLIEKIDASTKERLAKDEKLKEYQNNLAILTRQYNAAIGEGATADAKTLELKMTLFRSLIGAREDMAKNDPVYSEATGQLQEIIEQTEQSIVDDRKHIDQTLTKVQEDFSRNAPAVAKLPEEQKALALTVEQKLTAVNDARKAYDAAADQAQTAQSKIEQDQKAKASALQLEIAARKQEVLDAAQAKASHDTEVARQEKITTTQQQLATAKATEQKFQQQLDAISADIDNKERQRKAFVDSDLLRNEKLETKQAIDHDLKEVMASINAHTAERARQIVPQPTIEMQNFDEPDRRPIYAAGLGGGLFVLMMLPVLWTLMLTSRDAGHMPPSSPGAPSGQGFAPVLPEADATEDEDEREPAESEHAIS